MKVRLEELSPGDAFTTTLTGRYGVVLQKVRDVFEVELRPRLGEPGVIYTDAELKWMPGQIIVER